MIDWSMIIAALIAATPPTLAIILSWWSLRNANKETHVLINSRMDQLVTSEKKVSKAEGVAIGRAQKKNS